MGGVFMCAYHLDSEWAWNIIWKKNDVVLHRHHGSVELIKTQNRVSAIY